MKDYTNKNPIFADTVKILESTDTDHADNFNVPFKQLVDNDNSLKNAAVGRETEPQTLTAGQTSLTFTVDEIKENDIIEILTNASDVGYDALEVSENSITVTFEPQDKDIMVKVVIRNGNELV